MTFFHFGNCVALAYGPYFIAYKYSTLPEYGAFWKCVQAGGIYVITQLCKMLILATFFPTTDSLSGSSNIINEMIKTTIDFGDLVGLSVIMGKTVGSIHSIGSAHIKILIAGLGWSAADLLLTRALPLWVGARGLQFDWKYILMSLEANVTLVHHLSLAVLLWLWWRTDLSASLRPVAAFLLAFSVYRPLLPQILIGMIQNQPSDFALLAFMAVPTFCVAIISLQMFISYNATHTQYRN